MSDISTTNAEFTLKDSAGNIAVIRSFSDDYAAALKKVIKDLADFKTEVDSDNLNQKKLAYKDYRQEENQSDMPANIYFMIPVNASDEFVEFDPTTGKPKNPQPVTEVVDLKVTKYHIVYKDSEGTVSTLGEIDQQPDFALFATLAGNNVFTGDNTFNKDITVATGSTQDVSSIADNTVVAGKLAKALGTRITAIETEKPEWLKAKFEASKPESGSMVANTIYFYTAAKSAITD